MKISISVRDINTDEIGGEYRVFTFIGVLITL